MTIELDETYYSSCNAKTNCYYTISPFVTKDYFRWSAFLPPEVKDKLRSGELKYALFENYVQIDGEDMHSCNRPIAFASEAAELEVLADVNCFEVNKIQKF